MNLVDLAWPEVAALSRDMPVVIPVAAVEQHGHHLPVVTDSLLLGEIVARVSRRLGDAVLFAPLQWLGNSHHHLDFPGTLSASPNVACSSRPSARTRMHKSKPSRRWSA